MNEENKKMTLEEKTRSALNWSTASNVLSKLIMPLTNMILARLLTKDIFGIVASINIVIALAEIFADSGFSKYLVQADFESDKQFELHKSVSFWTSTGISLVMFLLIVIFRDSLATLIGSSGYGLVLAIAAIQIPIYSFSSISTAILRRNFEFKKLFFVRMSGVVITLTVSVIFALLKFEHWSLIIGSLSSIVIQTVILFILSNFKAKFIFSFSVLKQMIYFSINSFLEALLAWAASSIILAFVNIKLGNDISGIYKMGNTTVSGIFNTFSAIFIPVLFSNLSRQKEDNREFDSTYFAYQRSAAYVIIPAVIGVTIFRPLIVNIFLGSGWSEVEEIIAFQAIALIINILFRSFPGMYFLAKGKPQKLVITQIIWLIMSLPVSYFAIDLGIVNFVKINVILNFILCLITYVWLWFSYKVSIKETLLVLIKPIIISVPMVIIGLLSYKISTNLYLQLGVIIMCVFIYFGTFYLVFKNDFKKLISLFTKSEKIEKKTSVINSARLGEKMRIVQIIPSLQIVGGAERFVVDLAIAQQKLGHDVLIISLYEKGKCYFEQDIIDNNLNVVFLNKKKGFDWKNSRLLRKTILDFKPDVVNTHIVSHLSMQLSGLWKRKSTITFFHTIHSVPSKEANKPVYYMIMKSKYKKGIVHPVGISNSLAEATQKYYVLKSKPRAIYNGIFIGKYSSEVSINERKNNFISVASFGINKNQIMITKAATALNNKGYNFSLLFAGDGPQLESVKNYVAENNMGDYIKFLGQIKNVNEVLAKSQCFLLPSFYEGNPISILEAMSAGLAVIATKEGGPKDIIEENINGYLVDPHNEDDLIEKMEKILTNPKQLEVFSNNNIEKVQQYDMNSVAKEYINYYESIMAKLL